ncbi:beta-galactosidase [Bacteroidia bacterium]|nr:beta-galactosidase [Bacteroidia bacterium]
MKNIKLLILFVLVISAWVNGHAQGLIFPGYFSPDEGLITPQEKPYREEICLNGYWNLQIVSVPDAWKSGAGEAPELPFPATGKWETTKIKIPSPINVNNWGGGNNTGEDSPRPYAPSSVYYPSYPKHWDNARMAWLKKTFAVPAGFNDKRLILHFEAVAGECAVWVNGREAVRNFDSHLPFEADITGLVKKDGENELLVGLRHTKLFDKKHTDYSRFGATYPTGSNTDDLLGIWQDVFLFALPALRVTDVFVKPHVSRNELEIQIQIANQTSQKRKINVQGTVNEWINNISTSNPVSAAEINWRLGETALSCNTTVEIAAGATQTVSIRTSVNNRLKYWSPDAPNLYTLLLQLSDKKTTYDLKATRFGWREFSIAGDEFHLNGQKIQCFGDIQHPFSAYICSRRFAYAWYKMIKDFGGNAVRPHAQPWPRVYYDLADEMGLMVLDETALFGSSIRLNLEEEITWQRSKEHLKRLILRDRNHPAVIGWSAGNEMFAIALLNKPAKEIAAKWDDKLVDLALSAKQTDDTRDFITLDGDRDMEGRLPVWSKHFSHGLKLEDLPKGLNKPLIVGESGATYYGRPIQLYPFAGDRAFQSYYGRSEALAIDAYQNAKQMALPCLAYFSPSEVSWFGIEHLNLGYNDYSRLPGLQDGIFAGKPYEEGRPGYQYERIPPYVTTFNPGLDPGLPLYKPLPMFSALQAALTGKESPWSSYREHQLPAKPVLPALHRQVYFVGNTDSALYRKLDRLGLEFSQKPDQRLLIIEAENVSEIQLQTVHSQIEKMKKEGGIIWLMLAGRKPSEAAQTLLPLPLTVTRRTATSLNNNRQTPWGNYFDAPDLYFAEVKEGDRQILKQGLAGELVEKGTVVLSAANVDWSLFNEQPENRKCAQIVLYEHLEKPSGAALLTYPLGKATLVVSALDYHPEAQEYTTFWRNLLSAMQIKWNPVESRQNKKEKNEHNLLLDGPVN